MLGIIDYGVGNLFSLKSSLRSIGAEAVMIDSAEGLGRVDRIVLPGVGAFGDAVEKLRRTGLFDAIKREAASGKPILGICLGMQMLFERSLEFGWNELDFKPHPLFKYLKRGDCVYFVHSYYGTSCPSVIATADYGAPLTAAVADKNVIGCQFHPEKSGPVGLSILRAFCETGG